jgi:hypothetical protein
VLFGIFSKRVICLRLSKFRTCMALSGNCAGIKHNSPKITSTEIVVTSDKSKPDTEYNAVILRGRQTAVGVSKLPLWHNLSKTDLQWLYIYSKYVNMCTVHKQNRKCIINIYIYLTKAKPHESCTRSFVTGEAPWRWNHIEQDFSTLNSRLWVTSAAWN